MIHNANPAIVVVHAVINTFTLKLYKPIANGFSAREPLLKKKDVVSGVLEYQSSSNVVVLPVSPQLLEHGYVPVNAISRQKDVDHWSLIIHFREKFREASSQRLRNAANLMDQLLIEYSFVVASFDNMENNTKGLFLISPKFRGEEAAPQSCTYPVLRMTGIGVFEEVQT